MEVAVARMKQAGAEARFYLAASKLKSALLESRYRPDQPRAPAGSAIGGQWTSDGGARTAFVRDIARATTGTGASTQLVAGLDDDLLLLGGGKPRVGKTPKGAPLFIFPNGWVLRFDLEPGQYLRGQKPHINLEHYDLGLNFHIDLG